MRLSEPPVPVPVTAAAAKLALAGEVERPLCGDVHPRARRTDLDGNRRIVRFRSSSSPRFDTLAVASAVRCRRRRRPRPSRGHRQRRPSSLVPYRNVNGSASASMASYRARAPSSPHGRPRTAAQEPDPASPAPSRLRMSLTTALRRAEWPSMSARYSASAGRGSHGRRRPDNAEFPSTRVRPGFRQSSRRREVLKMWDSSDSAHTRPDWLFNRGADRPSFDSGDRCRCRTATGAALLHRGFFALFMGSFARGCVSPVAISGGTSSRPARTGVFSAASRASSRRRTPSVFSPTGARVHDMKVRLCRTGVLSERRSADSLGREDSDHARGAVD